jgi:calcyphosin
MVWLAYAQLDRTGDGVVNLKDVLMAYNAKQHPDFLSGARSETEIVTEFMQIWETHKKDGVITKDEFLDYYKDISCSIDNDDYFELMVRNAWHIAGGEGWCENTTITRYLETDEFGNQRVATMKDDLGKKAPGKTSGRVDFRL